MKVIDYRSKDEISSFQLRKIKEAVEYAYNHSKFYKRLYKKAKISPDKIKKLEDIERLPLVTRSDVVENNWSISAISKSNWIDISTTSGTTGRPIYLPWSKKDFVRLSKITSILHKIAGITKEDIVQITYPLGAGMWIAGIHNWLGLYVNECCSLRMGPGFSEDQVKVMKDLEATVLLGSPSFILKLGNIARKKRVLRKMKVRLICVSGENIVNNDFSFNKLGKKIVDTWKGVKVKPVYGASEGSICGTVCDRGRGYHISSNFFYLEILDPKTYKVLPPGEIGILVMTVFDAEAFPLIRYVIGDLTFIFPEECKCGWNSFRLGPILGRADKLFKFKGILINPEELGGLVQSIKQVDHYYIEVIKDEEFMDRLKICIGCKGRMEGEARIKEIVKEKVKSRFRINVDVFIKPVEIVKKRIFFDEKGELRRKPVHFFDFRKEKER